MIKLDFIKSIVVKIKHRPANAPSNPARDWQLILIVFCLIFAGIVFLSWKLDYMVTKDSLSPAIADKSAITINRTLMDKVVNFYKNQEELFKQDKSSKVNQADPS